MTELTIQKRRSGTISGAERITGVKNAQAEMLLSRRLNQFHNNYKRAQLKIQLEEYRLEHEAKLLTLDNKTHDLEYKKRLYPQSDLSHEEMSVNKLQKYLVRNAEKLCYLDKKLTHNVRNQSSAERIPAVVAKARLTIRRKELLKEMEEARLRMYSFLRSDGQYQRDAETVFMSDIDEEEDGELDKAIKENQAIFPEIPDISIRPPTMRKQKTIKEKLTENPITREAIHEHHRLREQEMLARPTISPASILARMARKRPLTKTEMMEEVEKVQHQVNDFNKKTEEAIWNFKKEEFQQGLKFVKDKDAELNKFMQKMNKRSRAPGEMERPQTTPTISSSYSKRTIPAFVQRRPLTESQRKRLLMENLLVGVERKAETAPSSTRKGIPHHTADRIARNTISAKMQRLLEAKTPDGKPNPTTATSQQQPTTQQ